MKIEFEVSREAADAVAGDLIGYRFTIGTCRLTKGNPNVGGQNQDVMLPLEFAAERTPGTRATSTLTLAGQPANNDTVTIGGKVYTFQTVLTNVDGNVLIGATASDTIDNLVAAIGLGAGSGATYAAATTVHPTVTAAAGAGDTMTVQAVAAGTPGNAIATLEAGVNTAWGAATLTGGVDSYTLKVEKLLKA